MCKGYCVGKCNTKETETCYDPTPMEDNEFHLKMAAFPILFMLCRFGGKPLENVGDIRERADNFHQKLMEIVGDMESRIDEMKKEAEGNEV